MDIEKNREEFRSSIVPKIYFPKLHLFISFLLPLLLAGLILEKIEKNISSLLAFILIFLYLDLSLYLIHRFPMHRITKGASKLHWFHTLHHHMIFTNVENTIFRLRDIYMVLFPPSLVLFFYFVYYPAYAWLVSLIFGKNVGYLFYFSSVIYFFLYEVFHLSGHLSETSFIRKLPWIGTMGKLHQKHHDHKLMQTKNFGIVLPLYDYLFKTKV